MSHPEYSVKLEVFYPISAEPKDIRSWKQMYQWFEAPSSSFSLEINDKCDLRHSGDDWNSITGQGNLFSYIMLILWNSCVKNSWWTMELNSTSKDTASVPRGSQRCSSHNKGAILNPLHMLLFLIKLQIKSKKPRNVNLNGHALRTLGELWCSSEYCPSPG